MSLQKHERDFFDPFFGDWKVSFPKELQVDVKCDIKENEKEFTIHAEVAGVPKDAIKVEHVGQRIKISGEVKNQKEEKDEKHHLKERSFGKFERQFTLPRSANMEGMKAKYENGVLNITVPKQQAEQVKTNIVKIE